MSEKIYQLDGGGDYGRQPRYIKIDVGAYKGTVEEIRHAMRGEESIDAAEKWWVGLPEEACFMDPEGYETHEELVGVDPSTLEPETVFEGEELWEVRNPFYDSVWRGPHLRVTQYGSRLYWEEKHGDGKVWVDLDFK